MNYIIEDGVDFFAELSKNTSVNDNDNNITNTEVCLISGLPLSQNNIQLECNHKFNYSYLFKEIVNQKTVYHPNSITKLKTNQLQCPYCRQISNNLIPYIPSITGITKVHGVNTPQYFCMDHKKCEWCYKSGEKKGLSCAKNAFETDFGTFCEGHWKINVKNRKRGFETCKQNNVVWTTEMDEVMQKNTIVSLKEN